MVISDQVRPWHQSVLNRECGISSWKSCDITAKGQFRMGFLSGANLLRQKVGEALKSTSFML